MHHDRTVLLAPTPKTDVPEVDPTDSCTERVLRLCHRVESLTARHPPSPEGSNQKLDPTESDISIWQPISIVRSRFDGRARNILSVTFHS